MDSILKPLEQVAEAAEWFVRTPELRAMHVLTNGAIRGAVLKHLCATEVLDFNTCPFFVLEAPTEPGDDGWALRSEELRGDWESLVASAGASCPLPPLWPAEGSAGVTQFSLELGRALAALRPPMTGLVIVLAPVWVRDRGRWCDDLAVLLRVKALAGARFVVVESDEPYSLPVFQKMGPLAERVDARVDTAALDADARASLDAIRAAGAGASGFQLVGGAGPAVTPPPRRGQPPALSSEQRAALAQELGLSPALFDPDSMKTLRVLVLSAAAAMRENNPAEAVRMQREARDFCVQHQLVREAVVNELVLAGYLLQAGLPERALEIFRAGRGRAEAAHLMDLAVQAQTAVASCFLLMKAPEEAAAEYAEAGRLGASAGAPAPILAIEAYRMCGQLLASRRNLEGAAAAFRRAIETGEAGGPEVKRSSTFVEAARQLATLCRKHGLIQQADSLDAQAAAVEHGEESGAATHAAPNQGVDAR